MNSRLTFSYKQSQWVKTQQQVEHCKINGSHLSTLRILVRRNIFIQFNTYHVRLRDPFHKGDFKYDFEIILTNYKVAVARV